MIKEDEFLPVNIEQIRKQIEKILDNYISDNFEGFIKELLNFRKIIIKFDPENLDLPVVDFLMDENMWSWIISAVNKKPTEFDWEGAGYIAADLKEILENENNS